MAVGAMHISNSEYVRVERSLESLCLRILCSEYLIDARVLLGCFPAGAVSEALG
jgi:hypothetical protein